MNALTLSGNLSFFYFEERSKAFEDEMLGITAPGYFFAKCTDGKSSSNVYYAILLGRYMQILIKERAKVSSDDEILVQKGQNLASFRGIYLTAVQSTGFQSMQLDDCAREEVLSILVKSWIYGEKLGLIFGKNPEDTARERAEAESVSCNMRVGQFFSFDFTVGQKKQKATVRYVSSESFEKDPNSMSISQSFEAIQSSEVVQRSNNRAEEPVAKQASHKRRISILDLVFGRLVARTR